MSKGKRKRERRERLEQRKQTTGELEAGVRDVLRAAAPILVHLPADPELELAPGDTYRAACGKMTRLPETVRQRRCKPMGKEPELYLVGLPNERYYETCEPCDRLVG